MAIPIVTQHPVHGYSPGYAVIAGSFATNGSSAPASTSVIGTGFSVARSNTGLYTVTLTVPVVDVVSMNVSRTESTAGTFLVSPTSYVSASRTFTIRTTTPAAPDTASNVAAATHNKIHFTLIVKTIKGSR